MAGKHVLSWLQKGWTMFVDPEREKRLDELVKATHKAMSVERGEFNFDKTVKTLGIADEDVPEVARRLFKKCLLKAWEDDELSEREQRSLAAIAKRLNVPTEEVTMLQRMEAKRVFGAIVTKAFVDGNLSDAEYHRLELVTGTCGATPAEFFRSEFAEEGEGFIRNHFVKLDVSASGKIEDDDWRGLLRTARRLGMSEAEFRQAIEAPAEHLVEHYLADFKSDEEITQQEATTLEWMLTNLIHNQQFAQYVRTEVQQIRRFTEIKEGRLPSLPAPKTVALRAGEIVHFVSACTFTRYVQRKSGQVDPVQVSGLATVTDDRLIFTSQTQSHDLIHRRILGYRPTKFGLDVQASGKAAGIYEFEKDVKFGILIWMTAIQLATQNLIARQDASADVRRIPRDVRQRVWQRYGGRCAECNATNYLEFDHIIPVAKGGGCTDNNIQLLCRGCNSKKSDKI